MKFPKNKLFRRPKLFKRLNAPYRLVFIDDESLEEVATFSLTKSTIYVLFSTLFVLSVVITVIILLFTPLKYYIPGYGDNNTHREVVRLKKNVDSLSDVLNAQLNYTDNIKKLIAGEYDGKPDTTMLDMDKVKREHLKSFLPAAEDIKKQALKPTPAQPGRKNR